MELYLRSDTINETLMVSLLDSASVITPVENALLEDQQHDSRINGTVRSKTELTTTHKKASNLDVLSLPFQTPDMV
jgi:hypothetical protein